LEFWISQLFNGVSYGALLFLLAGGLSLIFGMMRIVNMTHGSYYLLGGYVALTVIWRTGSFALAILLGALTIALVGIAQWNAFLQRLSGQELGQVLTTMGFALIFQDLALILWGGDPYTIPVPAALSGSLVVGRLYFPVYRIFIIAVAVAIALILWLTLERTRIGAMIRAGVDDMQMARAVGIPVSKLFTAVFCLGAALAGAGGIIGGPIMSAYPGLDADMLPLALIVVMLGGVGSLLGAFVGSFLIGAIYTFGTALLPDLAYVILFLPMIVVIAFRPRGLFGRRSV